VRVESTTLTLLVFGNPAKRFEYFSKGTGKGIIVSDDSHVLHTYRASCEPLEFPDMTIQPAHMYYDAKKLVVKIRFRDEFLLQKQFSQLNFLAYLLPSMALTHNSPKYLE